MRAIRDSAPLTIDHTDGPGPADVLSGPRDRRGTSRASVLRHPRQRRAVRLQRRRVRRPRRRGPRSPDQRHRHRLGDGALRLRDRDHHGGRSAVEPGLPWHLRHRGDGRRVRSLPGQRGLQRRRVRRSRHRCHQRGPDRLRGRRHPRPARIRLRSDQHRQSAVVPGQRGGRGRRRGLGPLRRGPGGGQRGQRVVRRPGHRHPQRELQPTRRRRAERLRRGTGAVRLGDRADQRRQPVLEPAEPGHPREPRLGRPVRQAPSSRPRSPATASTTS